ncbi:hypothetical protein N0V93_010141 [Gnomoniopsis smithogilvyi]|uniref:Transcription factor IIIC subunit delta N-term-domain-containing protein n=1 Tax=Gnomoniopsis smithogilvyi TaxID=1191159 RepID=A0A9W8YID7_9PEZI|nr:hypothetical protein N0V93_010141 [Gnomoniopsis smithogilvyi]
MKNSKVLPLHSIDLKRRPHNHRALAWSSDAELAVAADDSVTIYLPTFPSLDPAQPFPLDDDAISERTAQQPSSAPPAEDEDGMGILPANLLANDEGDDDLGSGDEEDEEDEGDDDGDEDGDEGNGSVLMGTQGLEQPQAQAQDRRQYSEETARVLWVSHPALHPELNLHVWEAAGKAMPLIRSAVGEINDEGGLFGDRARVAPPVEGEDQMTGNWEESLAQEVNSHPGAGTGVIGGAGSSLNHVVAVEWSPSGLGRNLRPVLAVLTGCGSLVVYGEGGPLPFGSNAKPSRIMDRGKSLVRNLQSWLVLWAVGENFVVPGQEEFGYGEFVKSFAWCQEIGTGRALLSYMNDLKEVVVLCIGTTFQKTEEGLEEAIWNVQEIARMETGGPHGQVDPCDPDFVPSGSSYCVQWSSWIKGETTWSCLLSYMDMNYVGFKKITINAPTWSPREAPNIVCEATDWDGRCVHLATDAFLEFEDTIWDINGNLICRGIIATPLLAEPFEVNLTTPTGPKPPHSTAKCNTTLPPKAIHNPITGLIIHPIPLETTASPLTPLYTAVRLSATATTPQWIESNYQHPESPPQWFNAIQSFINQHVPLGQAGRVGDLTAEAEEDGEDGIVRGPDENEEYNNKPAAADGDDEEEEEDEDDADPDADFDPWANEGPDVYPYNMRLWGIARSPGGGTTAVLATPLLTQRPMRDAWGAHRSRVLFGWQTRVGETDAAASEETTTHSSTGPGVVSSAVNLTTEARLWEWMYGSGPGIAGLTPRLEPDRLELARRAGTAAPHAQDEAAAMARRASRVRDICRPFVAAQRCEICGEGSESAITPIGGQDGSRVLDAVCAQGHRVAVCGVTGLAIMAPRISRACGVCQSRIIGWNYLLERILRPAGLGEDVVAFVRGEMGKDICSRCGGKYLD